MSTTSAASQRTSDSMDPVAIMDMSECSFDSEVRDEVLMESLSPYRPPPRTPTPHRGTKLITSSPIDLPPPIRRRLTIFGKLGFERTNEWAFAFFKSNLGGAFILSGVVLVPIILFVMLSASDKTFAAVCSYTIFVLHLVFYVVIGLLNYDVCCMLVRCFDFWYLTAQMVFSAFSAMAFVNFDVRALGFLCSYIGAAFICIFFDAWPPTSLQSVRSLVLSIIGVAQLYLMTAVYLEWFSDVNYSTLTLGWVKYGVDDVLILTTLTSFLFNVRYVFFIIHHPLCFALYRHRINSPLRDRVVLRFDHTRRESRRVTTDVYNDHILTRQRSVLPPPVEKALPLEFDETSLNRVVVQSRMTLARIVFGKRVGLALWSVYRWRPYSALTPLWCVLGLTGSLGCNFLSTTSPWYYVMLVPGLVCSVVPTILLVLLSNWSILYHVGQCFMTYYVSFQSIVMLVSIADCFSWSIRALPCLAWVSTPILLIITDALPVFQSKFTRWLVYSALFAIVGLTLVVHMDWYNFERDRRIPDPRGEGIHTSTLAAGAASACVAYIVRGGVHLLWLPHCFSSLTSRVKSPLLYSKQYCSTAHWVCRPL